MIEPHVRDEILRRLKSAEQEHSMRILYACESGSRAWGFASPDSDYDVRFVYARPTDWYLSFDVENKRDVIEYPIVDEIDCNGWDIRKALYLFTRTNGALLEWLVSPITYIDEGGFSESLRNLSVKAFNDIALCYHYSHMARTNAREYLYNDQVKLKKYLYVLRPLLAIRHIQQTQTPPPIEFAALVESQAPAEIKPAIAELLEIKTKMPERSFGAPIPAINEFIEAEMARHGEAFSGQGRPDIIDSQSVRNQLNLIFRDVLAA